MQKIVASKPVQSFIQNHPKTAQAAAKLGSALGISSNNSKSASNMANIAASNVVNEVSSTNSSAIHIGVATPPATPPDPLVLLDHEYSINKYLTGADQQLLLDYIDDPYADKVLAKMQAEYEKAVYEGSAEPGGFMKYYMEACASIREGEESIRVMKRVDGEKVETTIKKKEILLNLDDSKGAQLVAKAMELAGLEYEGKARLDRDESKSDDLIIDCSGLVYWSVYQVAPEIAADAKDGTGHFGKGAKYQIEDSDNVVWKNNSGPIDYTDLRAGDLLYFADASGTIAHTGIYVGNGQMIDSAGGGVMIREIAEHREWDGGSSTLVQINRLFED